MDEEGASLKENLLTAVAAPTEVISAGIVAADRPKEKAAEGADETSYFFSSTPWSQETNSVPSLMAEREDKPKKNHLPPRI